MDRKITCNVEEKKKVCLSMNKIGGFVLNVKKINETHLFISDRRYCHRVQDELKWTVGGHHQRQGRDFPIHPRQVSHPRGTQKSKHINGRQAAA